MGDDLQHFLIKLIYVGKFQMSTLHSAKPAGEQKTCALDVPLPASPAGWCTGARWWQRRHGRGSLAFARSRLSFLGGGAESAGLCLQARGGQCVMETLPLVGSTNGSAGRAAAAPAKCFPGADGWC